MPLTVPEAVENREAVLPDSLNHDDGGGTLGELHKVHDEELEDGLVGAARGLHESDKGRRIAGAVDAGKDSELVFEVRGD